MKRVIWLVLLSWQIGLAQEIPGPVMGFMGKWSGETKILIQVEV
jgi:hypothetical protein